MSRPIVRFSDSLSPHLNPARCSILPRSLRRMPPVLRRIGRRRFLRRRSLLASSRGSPLK